MIEQHSFYVLFPVKVLEIFLTLGTFWDLKYRQTQNKRVMKRIISLFTILFLTSGMVFADEVWRNETLRYTMYLGPIKAGEASLATKNVVRNGQSLVQMDLIARTTNTVEKIFSLNDTLTTIVNPKNAAPVYFQKHCFEEDDIVKEKVSFSTTGSQCTAVMRKDYKDGRVKERTQTVATQVYDMVSVVGFARSIDATNLYKGKRFDFKLADACDIIDEVLIYQGKETVKIQGKKYNCMVFKLVEPYVEKGKKKEREILNIYVNNDAKRTIVQMDIKFKVGSAKVKLN